MRSHSSKLRRRSTATLGAIVFGTTLVFNSPITSFAQAVPVANQTATEDKQLEPSDLFFQAHLKRYNGEKAEKEGDFKTAWKEYSSALKYYQNLKLTHRLWKPEVIDYRINATTKVLEKIKPQLKNQLEKEQAAAEGIISDKTKFNLDLNQFDTPPELLKITNGINLQQDKLADNKKKFDREQVLQRAHLNRLEGELKLFEKNNQANPAQAAKIEKEIARTRALLENIAHYSKTDQKKILDNITKLKKQLAKHSSAPLKADLERSQKDLNRRTAEVRIMAEALVESKQEQEVYQQKMQKMAQQLTLSKAENSKLTAQLKEQSGTSTKVVKALYAKLEAANKREKTLIDELKETKVMLAELSEKFDQQSEQNKELKQQLRAVTDEKDRLAALMLQDPNERIRTIVKQNLGLIQDLKNAKDALQRVSKDHASNQDRLVTAERDLAVAKQRILDQQTQSLQDNRRIKELQRKLIAIQNSASDQLSTGTLTAAEKEENTLLRSTAKKLMAREVANTKKLALLQKHILTQNDDPIGLALVHNNINADTLQLSEKEKQILNKKRVADATFTRKSKGSLADTRSTEDRIKNDVKTIHRVVDGLIQRGRLASAKDLLEDANGMLPNNFSTLMNLGTVTMKMQDLDNAETHFKDGIVMKRNNPYAHYMLGLCQYRKGKGDIAEKSLQSSVELDGSQEKAYYYLGVIAGQSGRLETAEKYFKIAIRINPDLDQAYFALSVNCLLQNKISEAQDYYQEALQKGLAPVPTHAEKLGLPH